MSMSVRELRLSFIWSDFNPALFATPVPDVPAAFLADEVSYSAQFLIMQDNYRHPRGFTPPWPSHQGKEFWGMYLGKNPYFVDASRVWKRFVPFRMRLNVSSPATPLLTADALLYPHGCALLVQARLRSDADQVCELPDAVKRAHSLRYTDKITVANLPGVEQPLAMNSFSTAVRSAIARNMWHAGEDATFKTPYTIATFVRLEGVDVTETVKKGDAVHRALDAVTYWDAAWETAPLHDLPDNAASRTYYNGRHGQSTWHPALAADSPLHHRRLSCYHRNQTFAALQVQVLSDLVLDTAQRAKRGAATPHTQEACTRNAVWTLSLLHGGAADTYRSANCRAHVEQVKDTINFLRNLYACDPLQ